MSENEPQTKTISEENPRLIIPYYVNQGRLLDIYSILNHGYEEYEEITTSISSENMKEGKASVNGGLDFKIFKFGGNVSGTNTAKDGGEQAIKSKKVQTVTSLLEAVLSNLSQKKILKTLPSNDEGAFIEIPVKFQYNSLIGLIEQIEELLNLQTSISAITGKSSNSKTTQKQIGDIKKSFKILFGGMEVVYDSGDYAIIGKILDNNMYMSNKEDLVNTSLKCFCKIKKVYLNGTNLMKNTIFTRLKDKSLKDGLVNLVKEMGDNKSYSFEVTAISEINDKPVYEVEIIALYK